MIGFLKPDAGHVIVVGEDITDYSEKELQRIRKKVTMVFQNGALFNSLTLERMLRSHCANATTLTKCRSSKL